MKSRNYLLGFLLGLFSVMNGLQAQILDDSTVQVYGPNTTFYQRIEDVRVGNETYSRPDTSLNEIEQYLYNYQEGVLFQDLGLMLTPLHKVYLSPNHQVGTSWGMETLDSYMPSPERSKYFDTRSPYSRLSYVQGGRRQNRLKTTLYRPLTPRWSAGFEVQRATADRQVALRRSREIQTDHWSAAFTTRFLSKDSSYRLYAGYHHLRHKLFETGGILPLPGETRVDLFDYQLERVKLSDTVINLDTRHQWHLYHQYTIPGTQILLFHEWSRTARLNSFDDRNLRANIDFYPVSSENIIRDTSSIPIELYEQYYHHGRLQEHHVGAGWNINQDWNIRAGTRFRFGSMRYTNDTDGPSYSEQFLTTTLAYAKDSNEISIHGEIMPGRDFTLQVSGNYKGIQLYAAQSSISPALTHRLWQSRYYSWRNEFSNRIQSELKASYPLKVGKQVFSPVAEWSSVENMIYFDTLAEIRQYNGLISQWKAGIESKLLLGKWHFDLNATFAGTNNEDILRIPDIHARGRIYYANRVFKKTLPIQIGTYIFWMSAYPGMQYMPATMQYYLQNVLEIQGYLYAELFVSFRVRTSTVFFKVCQVNQGLMGENGYFVTPFYTAQQRSLEFGFNWNFYD